VNKLQGLITEKVKEGKSYRDIENECGINHVSISQYHKGVTPNGKNLAILADYFRLDYWELVEVKEHQGEAPANFGKDLDDQVAELIWSHYTPEQKRKATALLRELLVTDEKPDLT
jgi:transcriptional regulator with XRE-family HTH domain